MFSFISLSFIERLFLIKSLFYCLIKTAHGGRLIARRPHDSLDGRTCPFNHRAPSSRLHHDLCRPPSTSFASRNCTHIFFLAKLKFCAAAAAAAGEATSSSFPHRKFYPVSNWGGKCVFFFSTPKNHFQLSVMFFLLLFLY